MWYFDKYWASLLAQLVEESVCNAGDLGSIPWLGRSSGEGKSYPLQNSGLENSVDCIVHGVAKSWTPLSDFHFHFLSLTTHRTCLRKLGIHVIYLNSLYYLLFILSPFYLILPLKQKNKLVSCSSMSLSKMLSFSVTYRVYGRYNVDFIVNENF